MIKIKIRILFLIAFRENNFDSNIALRKFRCNQTLSTTTQLCRFRFRFATFFNHSVQESYYCAKQSCIEVTPTTKLLLTFSAFIWIDINQTIKTSSIVLKKLVDNIQSIQSISSHLLCFIYRVSGKVQSSNVTWWIKINSSKNCMLRKSKWRGLE